MGMSAARWFAPCWISITVAGCSAAPDDGPDGRNPNPGGAAGGGGQGAGGTPGGTGGLTGSGGSAGSGGAVGSAGSAGAGSTGGSGGSSGTGGSGGSGGSVGGTIGASGTAGEGAGGAIGGSGGGATDCTPPAQALAAGDHEFTIQSANGMTYRYTLVVPRSLVPTRKAPLSVVWHALQSSPEETRGLTDIDARSEAAGSITVHPRSPDASWDVGSCCTTVVLGRRRDETVFVKELLRDVKSKVCVDERHIYTAGFSNGGMMSQMLACKMADVFAAAAPMGSTLTIPAADCRPSRPIPIFMINGTADPLVGYSAPGLAGGLSVPNAFTTWADRNGCMGSPEVTVQQGQATCRTYKQCGGGVEVTLCTVDGMGHCMPGMKKESPINCFTKLIPLGMPNDDINGVQMSLDFFSKYALP